MLAEQKYSFLKIYWHHGIVYLLTKKCSNLFFHTDVSQTDSKLYKIWLILVVCPYLSGQCHLCSDKCVSVSSCYFFLIIYSIFEAVWVCLFEYMCCKHDMFICVMCVYVTVLWLFGDANITSLHTNNFLQQVGNTSQ